MDNKKVWWNVFVDFETTGIDIFKDLPIEVALLIVDEWGDIQWEYQSYIWHQGLSREGEWKEKYRDAYKVHQIEYHDYKKLSKPFIEVVGEIQDLIMREFLCANRKFVLVSDNAAFEHVMMLRLFKEANCYFPFHYNTESTKQLTYVAEEKTGCNHIKGNHRAMADCYATYYNYMFPKKVCINENTKKL